MIFLDIIGEKQYTMKICIITCHDVYNFGASLQAYALQHYLEELGHEVEIINYRPAIYIKNMIGNHLQVKSLISLIVSL